MQKIEIITANHYQTVRVFSQLVEAFDNDLGGPLPKNRKTGRGTGTQAPGCRGCTNPDHRNRPLYCTTSGWWAFPRPS